MTANDISTPKKAEDATRHPLALLADWLEAERDEPAANHLLGRPMTARLEDARAAVFNLDPAALRAQAKAAAVWIEITPSVLNDLSDGQRVWVATRTGEVREMEYQWCAGHYPHQLDGEDATDGYFTHLMHQHAPQHPTAQAQAGAGSEFALSGSEQNPDQGGEAL